MQLAPCIGLYTASLVSLTDVLIGWRASDCDAPTQLLRIQINTGYTAPSPTWRASPTWRKQKVFPLPETVALFVLCKSRELPLWESGGMRHGFAPHLRHLVDLFAPHVYHFIQILLGSFSKPSIFSVQTIFLPLKIDQIYHIIQMLWVPFWTSSRAPLLIFSDPVIALLHAKL